MKRLLSYDPLSGMKCFYESDSEGRKFMLHYQSDTDTVGALNDINTEQANGHKFNFMGKSGKDCGMRKVATFSPWVQMLWLNKYGYSPLDPKMLKVTMKRLNDPEWRKLRTSSEHL